MSRKVKFNYVLTKRGGFYHALPYETRSEKGRVCKDGVTLCGVPIGSEDTVVLNETKLVKGVKICKNCVTIAKKFIMRYFEVFSQVPGVNLKIVNKGK